MFYDDLTFINTYGFIALPFNGPKLWPISNASPINPPCTIREPRRLKKKRRKTNDEPKTPHKQRREQSIVKCKRCGE